MNKPFNGAEVLAAIKRNRERLEACKKHSFAYPEDRPLQFGEKLTCTKCGGVMDAVQAFRYCEGFEAAGGDPNEVIKGFR